MHDVRPARDARHFLSLHDYQVDAVRELDEGLVEVVMRPLGRHVDFVPGRFAMVYLEAKDGWHGHAFTIAGAPHEGLVRVTVKALGDYSPGCARSTGSSRTTSTSSTPRTATRRSPTRSGRSRPGTNRSVRISSTRASRAA